MEIAEQPQARGFRFRYPSEGSSHGGLQGENSARHKKTFPAVRVSYAQMTRVTRKQTLRSLSLS